ncbi:MAG: response regulator, partial [Hyphomicrobiales bacterium]|nr:response regulator [Hyphomicrobiales bacterium]
PGQFDGILDADETGEAIAPLNFDIVKPDGTVLPVTAKAVRLPGSAPDSEGGLFGTILERYGQIDQKVIEGQINELMNLLISAPIAVAAISQEGRITNANPAFAKFTGMNRVSGDVNLFELVDKSTLEPLQYAVEKAAANKASITPVDISIKDGKAGRLLLSSVPGARAMGVAALVFGIDTSEQRSLEEQIAQGQKMQAIGQLAGGIAHDFNNVLTAIIGFSDLLLANHRPSDPSFADIMNIKNNANRAAGLVRHMLAFSRKQTLRPVVMSLTNALEDLMNLLDPLLGEKVKARVIHGRDLWLVKVDPTQFEQVIMNLAVNARDAMPDGGEITIRTSNVSERESASLGHAVMEPGEYVLCEVSDTGIGMSAEVMDKIFEPFFSTKDVGKGTGLGLSTVYGIVKQTGGFIFADSKIDSGTVFRIYLPRCEESPAQPVGTSVDKPVKKEKEAGKDLTGSATVLLVEDEDAVRSFAARALTTRGYKVLEASSGAHALEVMNEHQADVDIVVSDVVMPEMDGPTMLKHLRKTNPGLKIIFISGYAEDAFRNGLSEDDASTFAFLPKPFSLKVLAEKVKDILEEN